RVAAWQPAGEFFAVAQGHERQGLRLTTQRENLFGHCCCPGRDRYLVHLPRRCTRRSGLPSRWLIAVRRRAVLVLPSMSMANDSLVNSSVTVRHLSCEQGAIAAQCRRQRKIEPRLADRAGPRGRWREGGDPLHDQAVQGRWPKIATERGWPSLKRAGVRIQGSVVVDRRARHRHGVDRSLASHCLGLAGYQIYRPLLREQRRRHGRKIIITPPLFPGYLFLWVVSGWWDARWSPGVVRLVMDGEQPARVSDQIIAEIRSRERNGFVEPPRPRGLRPGMRVRVISAPLSERIGMPALLCPHERVL